MLKQAIDAYNSLLDIVDFIKNPSFKVKSFIFGTAAMIVAAGSFLSAQALGGSSANEQGKQGDTTQALPLEQATGVTETRADKASTPDQASSAAADTSKSETSSEKKAAARAEESAASKSFHLSVTKNGQYEPGTLIAYDAVKDDRTYYAGDLVFGSASVTISKSAASQTSTVSVKIPDGAKTSVPVEPADDNSPYFTVSLDAAQSSSDNDHSMIVDLNGQVEVGTYQLHVAASRTGQSAATWWYHGFLTVNVVE